VTAILVGIALVLITSGIIFANEKRPVIKASDPGYLYMILLSIALGFGTSFIPLMPSSPSTCRAEMFCFAIFTTLISANLAWKCYKIYGVFAAANSFKKPRFGVLLKRSGQTWINLLSLFLVVALATLDACTQGGSSWKFEDFQESPHNDYYLTCTTNITMTDTPILIIIALVPTFFFSLTLGLAFKMRHFPHNFRETLNIFAATLIVLMCCVMFLSGYTLAHVYSKGFLRAIVIYVTSLAFLLCLFVPKVIILLRKNVDTEEEKAMINREVRAFSSREPRSSRKTIKAKAPNSIVNETP